MKPVPQNHYHFQHSFQTTNTSAKPIIYRFNPLNRPWLSHQLHHFSQTLHIAPALPFSTNPLLLPVSPSRSTLINFFRCSLYFSVSLFYHSFIHSSLCYQNDFNIPVSERIIQHLHSLQHAQEKLRYIPSDNRDYVPPRRTESPETRKRTRNRGQTSKAGWGSC